MGDLVLKLDVAGCASAKLTRDWGVSLVDTLKESLAVVAASINAMNSNISKMGTQFQEFQKHITTVCKDVKLAAEKAESARAIMP